MPDLATANLTIKVHTSRRPEAQSGGNREQLTSETRPGARGHRASPSVHNQNVTASTHPTTSKSRQAAYLPGLMSWKKALQSYSHICRALVRFCMPVSLPLPHHQPGLLSSTTFLSFLILSSNCAFRVRGFVGFVGSSFSSWKCRLLLAGVCASRLAGSSYIIFCASGRASLCIKLGVVLRL